MEFIYLSIYLLFVFLKKVYGTCLIANIPSTVSRTLRNKVDKMRPLFNVGVSDIPMVEATEGGYAACKFYNHYYTTFPDSRPLFFLLILLLGDVYLKG